MTRLTLHIPDSAPAASRPMIDRSIQSFGFLPNLVSVLASSPVALEAFLSLSEIVSRGTLSLDERLTVQIAAARLHGSDASVAMHSASMLKKGKLDRVTVIALQQGHSTGISRIDALQAFTSAVVGVRGAVPNAALQSFLSAGFTEAQALEVVLGTSLATLGDFTHTLSQVPMNPQVQAYRAGNLSA